MHRKEFLKVCGVTCLGLAGITILNGGCRGTHYFHAVDTEDKLVIPLKEFRIEKRKKTQYRKYVVVKSVRTGYPIVVYRFDENSYAAMLMRCTHQGTELNVNGDILTCPAHGSEFGNKGEVIQGPAEKHLTSFKTSHDKNYVYIDLST